MFGILLMGPFTIWGALLSLISLGIISSLIIARKKDRYIIRFKGGGKRLLEGEVLKKWSTIAIICMSLLFGGGIALVFAILPEVVVILLFLICIFTMIISAISMGQSI